MKLAGAYALQAHNIKNWFVDSKHNRVLFLCPHWITKSKEKAEEIGFATYRSLVNNKLVRKIESVEEIFFQVILLAISALAEEVTATNKGKMLWTVEEDKSKRMLPVDLEECEKNLIDYYGK